MIANDSCKTLVHGKNCFDTVKKVNNDNVY